MVCISSTNGLTHCSGGVEYVSYARRGKPKGLSGHQSLFEFDHTHSVLLVKSHLEREVESKLHVYMYASARTAWRMEIAGSIQTLANIPNQLS